MVERRCSYPDVVAPDDPQKFIHLVVADSDEVARRKMRRFTMTLAGLGLRVSTGRVVEFRARKFLVQEAAQPNTVPLIYSCHFKGAFVQWPRADGRKPNAILDTGRTQDLLVRSAVYVLVKRFTTKEERRRVVACILDSGRIDAERIGIENHLNYIHAAGQGLPMELAKGLTAFLNSTMVDAYFRQFSGHTQVNATDLRSMPFPDRSDLGALGKRMIAASLGQSDLDGLVEEVLL